MGQESITVILAFGAANLIYLVTEELLMKAQKVPETPASTTLFFLGFLLVFVRHAVLTPMVTLPERRAAGI